MTKRHVCAGFDFVFQMYLLVRYFRSLEEGSFRGRSSAFLWMLIVGATLALTYITGYGMVIHSRHEHEYVSRGRNLQESLC
jgi:hypothetical protein